MTVRTVSCRMAYPSDGPFRRCINDSRRLHAGICRVVLSLMNPNGNTAYHRGMTQLSWVVRHQFALPPRDTNKSSKPQRRFVPDQRAIPKNKTRWIPKRARAEQRTRFSQTDHVSNSLKGRSHETQVKYRLFLLPFVLAVASVAALAQANSELTGIVTDQTGAVVPDAKITLTDPATGFTKIDNQRCDRPVRHLRSEPRQLQHEGHSQGLPGAMHRTASW